MLDLSFLGWYLLSALTLGILAIFYVTPYKALTHAGFYVELERLYWNPEGKTATADSTPANDAPVNAPVPPSAVSTSWTCPDCNAVNEGQFCGNCGAKRPTAPSNNGLNSQDPGPVVPVSPWRDPSDPNER